MLRNSQELRNRRGVGFLEAPLCAERLETQCEDVGRSFISYTTGTVIGGIGVHTQGAPTVCLAKGA